MSHRNELVSSIILSPSTSRDLTSPRWRLKTIPSARTIHLLKRYGVTLQNVKKDLKPIHRISDLAYSKTEIVCSKVSFRILASCSLSIATFTFVSIILLIVSYFLLDAIIINIGQENTKLHDALSGTLTASNIVSYTKILLSLSFIFLIIGLFIIFKAWDNKINQYTESILAVYEHLNTKLTPKYKKNIKDHEKQIKWSLFIYGSKVKKYWNVFLPFHKKLTYYGIMINLDQTNDDEYDTDEDNIKYPHIVDDNDHFQWDNIVLINDDNLDENVIKLRSNPLFQRFFIMPPSTNDLMVDGEDMINETDSDIDDDILSSSEETETDEDDAGKEVKIPFINNVAIKLVSQ